MKRLQQSQRRRRVGLRQGDLYHSSTPPPAAAAKKRRKHPSFTATSIRQRPMRNPTPSLLSMTASVPAAAVVVVGSATVGSNTLVDDVTSGGGDDDGNRRAVATSVVDDASDALLHGGYRQRQLLQWYTAMEKWRRLQRRGRRLGWQCLRWRWKRHCTGSSGREGCRYDDDDDDGGDNNDGDSTTPSAVTAGAVWKSGDNEDVSSRWGLRRRHRSWCVLTDHLPTELYLHICSYLSADDCCTLLEVSHAMHAAITSADGSVWRRLCLRAWAYRQGFQEMVPRFIQLEAVARQEEMEVLALQQQMLLWREEGCFVGESDVSATCDNATVLIHRRQHEHEQQQQRGGWRATNRTAKQKSGNGRRKMKWRERGCRKTVASTRSSMSSGSEYARRYISSSRSSSPRTESEEVYDDRRVEREEEGNVPHGDQQVGRRRRRRWRRRGQGKKNKNKNAAHGNTHSDITQVDTKTLGKEVPLSRGTVLSALRSETKGNRGLGSGVLNPSPPHGTVEYQPSLSATPPSTPRYHHHHHHRPSPAQRPNTALQPRRLVQIALPVAPSSTSSTSIIEVSSGQPPRRHPDTRHVCGASPQSEATRLVAGRSDDSDADDEGDCSRQRYSGHIKAASPSSPTSAAAAVAAPRRSRSQRRRRSSHRTRRRRRKGNGGGGAAGGKRRRGRSHRHITSRSRHHRSQSQRRRRRRGPPPRQQKMSTSAQRRQRRIRNAQGTGEGGKPRRLRGKYGRKGRRRTHRRDVAVAGQTPTSQMPFFYQTATYEAIKNSSPVLSAQHVAPSLASFHLTSSSAAVTIPSPSSSRSRVEDDGGHRPSHLPTRMSSDAEHGLTGRERDSHIGAAAGVTSSGLYWWQLTPEARNCELRRMHRRAVAAAEAESAGAGATAASRDGDDDPQPDEAALREWDALEAANEDGDMDDDWEDRNDDDDHDGSAGIEEDGDESEDDETGRMGSETTVSPISTRMRTRHTRQTSQFSEGSSSASLFCSALASTPNDNDSNDAAPTREKKYTRHTRRRPPSSSSSSKRSSNSLYHPSSASSSSLSSTSFATTSRRAQPSDSRRKNHRRLSTRALRHLQHHHQHRSCIDTNTSSTPSLSSSADQTIQMDEAAELEARYAEREEAMLITRAKSMLIHSMMHHTSLRLPQLVEPPAPAAPAPCLLSAQRGILPPTPATASPHNDLAAATVATAHPLFSSLVSLPQATVVEPRAPLAIARSADLLSLPAAFGSFGSNASDNVAAVVDGDMRRSDGAASLHTHLPPRVSVVAAAAPSEQRSLPVVLPPSYNRISPTHTPLLSLSHASGFSVEVNDDDDEEERVAPVSWKFAYFMSRREGRRHLITLQDLLEGMWLVCFRRSGRIHPVQFQRPNTLIMHQPVQLDDDDYVENEAAAATPQPLPASVGRDDGSGPVRRQAAATGLAAAPPRPPIRALSLPFHLLQGGAQLVVSSFAPLTITRRSRTEPRQRQGGATPASTAAAAVRSVRQTTNEAALSSAEQRFNAEPQATLRYLQLGMLEKPQQSHRQPLSHDRPSAPAVNSVRYTLASLLGVSPTCFGQATATTANAAVPELPSRLRRMIGPLTQEAYDAEKRREMVFSPGGCGDVDADGGWSMTSDHVKLFSIDVTAPLYVERLQRIAGLYSIGSGAKEVGGE